MNPVILVPRRVGDPWRDHLWDWARARWESLLPYPIIEGHHGGEGAPDDEGPLNISVAFNRAAAAATVLEPGWDVALLVGSDWLVDNAEQVDAALHMAHRRQILWFAHDRTLQFTEAETVQIVAEMAPSRYRLPEIPVSNDWPVEAPYGLWHKHTFSGVQAVPRRLWEEVEGFDERFVGWGGEDIAFWCACSAVGGNYDRVANAPVAHLWHPRTRADNEESATYPANDELMRRYLDIKWTRPHMLKLIAERHQ